MDKTSLYYKDGNSDKEYHVVIDEKDSGFVVNCSWGRRGSTLQTGTKTQAPVPYEKAKSIFDKLVQEKTSKGYSPGASGTPYQMTDKAQRATGIAPQLLNPVEEDEVQRLIADERFWAQRKFDGKRVLIRNGTGEVTGINRKGLSIGMPVPVVAAAKKFKVAFVIDGEACGDVVHAFDLLEMNGVDLRGLSYAERLRQLENLLVKRSGAIKLVETARTQKDKNALLTRLQSEEQEGVVFKRSDAPYVPGRPASGGNQLKFKFYATASCIVSKVNAKRSVALELLEGGKPVGVGNVTIPPNQSVPSIGAVIEVRYLYAFRQGSLFQPTCLGERDDIVPLACTTAQLKYKPDASDEDDA
jgi:bifunctional non-homologous end joining protein LigD